MEVLTDHNLMHIATIDEEGNPKVRGVDFAVGNKENELYFVTRKDSNKVKHITNNNRVSIAIDHDCPSINDLNNLRYIKATGRAELIDTEDEANLAMGTLIKKLPFLADIPGDSQDMTCIKVVMDQIILVDNTVAFGHEDICTYS